MEKSIHNVKITVSKKIKKFQDSVLNIIYAFYFHSYNNVTNTHFSLLDYFTIKVPVVL